MKLKDYAKLLYAKDKVRVGDHDHWVSPVIRDNFLTDDSANDPPYSGLSTEEKMDLLQHNPKGKLSGSTVLPPLMQVLFAYPEKLPRVLEGFTQEQKVKLFSETVHEGVTAFGYLATSRPQLAVGLLGDFAAAQEGAAGRVVSLLFGNRNKSGLCAYEQLRKNAPDEQAKAKLSKLAITHLSELAGDMSIEVSRAVMSLANDRGTKHELRDYLVDNIQDYKATLSPLVGDTDSAIGFVFNYDRDSNSLKLGKTGSSKKLSEALKKVSQAEEQPEKEKPTIKESISKLFSRP